MSVLTKLYVNCFTLYKAPRSYIKYLMYCILQNKEPDINLLAKIVRLSYFVNNLKSDTHKVVVKENNVSISYSTPLKYIEH